MAARTLHRPKDPEAVALAALALRNFVAPAANPTDFEAKTLAYLTNANLDQATAKKLLDNFDHVSKATRLRFLGNLGVAPRLPGEYVIEKRQLPVAAPPGVEIIHPDLVPRGRDLPADGPPPPAIDYTIRYEGIYCIDETGWDRFGSDEIYVVTSALHITKQGDNIVRTEKMPINGQGVYEGVDSYTKRVGPRAAVWNGKVAEVNGGMSLTTVVFEHDYGDPDHFRDEVDKLVTLAGAIATYFVPILGPLIGAVIVSGLVTDFFNWLLSTDDDVVGTKTTVLDMSTLEHFGRSGKGGYRPPGNRPFLPELAHSFFAQVNDYDYLSFYSVLRNPDAPYPQGEIE